MFATHLDFKSKYYISFAFNLILSVLCITALIFLDMNTKSFALRGFYQNVEQLPIYYSFSFTEKEFQFLMGDQSASAEQSNTDQQIIDQGNYAKIDTSTYMCHGKKQDFIISLNKSGFYYYNTERNELIYAEKISNIPSDFQI